MSTKCFGQTAYDRKQDIKMIQMAGAISGQTNQINILTAQVKTLDSTLKAFQAALVKSNTIIAYPPIYVKDSTDVIKVFYIKP